jgi:hypothetical protein
MIDSDSFKIVQNRHGSTLRDRCNPNPGYFKPKHDNDLICAHQLAAAYRRDNWKLVVQQEEDPYFLNTVRARPGRLSALSIP